METATTAGRACLMAVLVVVTAVTVSSLCAAAGGVESPAGRNCTEFIRQSCSATRYPSLCYSSLAGYAGAVGEDPTQIAHFAANNSLAQVSSLSYHVLLLYRAAAAAGVDPRIAAALGDCAESLGDAAELTRQAAAELGLLAKAEGPELAWHVSNAQTWMSAALTNEDTCTDGFAATAAAATAGGDVFMKADVARHVRRARRYTSIALALVNSLVGVAR
ncbi:unnamed protein product [Spirodela intermedia]|uniref:Pectinesterase inhibitor domain-containing protein n=2 Tax=Spirodela intermedia TaxID=51605 RepID=A0A7I8KUD4_SPIIN|nr:unnamed protein product [Spirodela intermedia]CAA6664808.1 unnamed protein product [Spirodela intermedia]CAA7401410.1 unnamed protein product [Spirodela intermedia]